MGDPQNMPPPGFEPPPKRGWLMIIAFLKLVAVILMFCIKLVAVVILFFVAFVAALAWPRK